MILRVSLKLTKSLREESGKIDGKLTEDDIQKILAEAPSKRLFQKISLPVDASEKVAGYGECSEKVITNIISLYLDLLECGEVDNVFKKVDKL